MPIRFIPLIVAISAIACGHPADNDASRREIFDATAQQVITSSANEKYKTVSILYGNSAALNAAIYNSNKHRAGELYTLVTWQQIDHPAWYGSHVNGRLQTIETVNTQMAADSTIQFVYNIKNVNPKKNIQTLAEPQERINFILNQQPSVFPDKQ